MSVLGYAEVTANQTGISAETDLTGVVVTVNVAAGRYVRVTGSYLISKQTNPGTVDGRIRESGTLLALWPSDPLLQNDFARNEASVVLTPSAGSHTYRVTLASSTASASNLAAADFPTFILVEDLGAV